MLSLPGQARAGDWSHSVPVTQGRVAQNSDLDTARIKEWKEIKRDDIYVRPCGTNMETRNLGAVVGEISLKWKPRHKIAARACTQPNPKRPKLPATQVPIFSNLNGIAIPVTPAKWNEMSEAQREALMFSYVKVAGIIGTTVEYDDFLKENGRKDFVNNIGGIYAVINTSPTKSIYAGQLVVGAIPKAALCPTWDTQTRKKLVRDRIQGTEPEKVLVETEPYDPMNIISVDSMNKMLKKVGPNRLWPKPTSVETNDAYVAESFMQDLLLFVFHINAVVNARRAGGDQSLAYKQNLEAILGGAGETVEDIETIFNPAEVCKLLDPTWKETVKSLIPRVLNGYSKVNRQYNERIIGIALSDAQPNEQFDIKQSNYCNS